jgi:hypothetical protein
MGTELAAATTVAVTTRVAAQQGAEQTALDAGVAATFTTAATWVFPTTPPSRPPTRPPLVFTPTPAPTPTPMLVEPLLLLPPANAGALASARPSAATIAVVLMRFFMTLPSLLSGCVLHTVLAASGKLKLYVVFHSITIQTGG